MLKLSTIPGKYGELLHGTAEDLKGLLRSERNEDVKLVQKGLLLYRQGLVSKARLEDDLVIATVQDVTKVHVELNLNFFQISNCSCPTEGICRHQLAVFFYTYAQVDSVTDWVETWRQPIQERKAAQNLGLQRAKDLLKASGILKPDYDRWVSTFHEAFRAMFLEQKNLKPYLINDLFQVYSKRIKASAPVEQEWRQLYFLVAAVHSFHNLLKLSTEQDFNEEEVNRYYRDLFYNLIDDAEDLVQKLNVHALPFAFDEFIEKLKNDSITLVSEDFILEFEPTHLYCILWTRLFKKKKWHEDELERLHHDFQGNKSLPVIIATIQQNFMLKKDEHANRLLQIIGQDGTPYMIFWLEKLTADKEWQRMGVYADTFISTAKDYIRILYDTYARMDFTRLAIRTIGAYALETKKHDLYEKIMIQTLPYSYRSYDEFLFDLGMYEKWSDLQAFIGYDISSIPSSKIKVLQKEQPEILLPLYHQSIQQHISMKNRGNYRQAVRELKKLRTLYKKLKRQDDFEQFLDILFERTKRLRAFQEECERGKLTHA